jgi:hypothetical protein
MLHDSEGQSPVSPDARLAGLREILNAQGIESPPPYIPDIRYVSRETGLGVVELPLDVSGMRLDVAYGRWEISQSPTGRQSYGDIPERVDSDGFGELIENQRTIESQTGRIAILPEACDLPADEVRTLFAKSETLHRLEGLGSAFMPNAELMNGPEVPTDEVLAGREEFWDGLHQQRLARGVQVATVLFSNDARRVREAVEQVRSGQ